MEKTSQSAAAPASNETRPDSFSKLFFWAIPFTVPLIVTGLTYLFYPFVDHQMIWLPLLLVYWATIWALALFYRAKRGSVFTRERFTLTLKLQGQYLWLQYLLTYGPLVYAIPLFVINYGSALSPAMFLAIIAAAGVNGPSEEIYWRACLDDAGKNAGVSTKARLVFAPVAFALWHTAFVIHLYPMDATWWSAWVGIILMTWTSGLSWLWVMHRSGRLLPQCIYHACANFLNIFPMVLVSVLHLYF